MIEIQKGLKNYEVNFENFGSREKIPPKSSRKTVKSFFYLMPIKYTLNMKNVLQGQ